MGEWTKRLARKGHRCDFCGEAIATGDEYFRVRLTPWDHPDNEGFFTWRAHPFCHELWMAAGPDWGWEWGDDPAAWRDAAKDYFPDRVAEYPFGCDGAVEVACG